MRDVITVQTVLNATMKKVWEYWNEPEHIIHWAFSSDDWQAAYASNNLRFRGRFKITKITKDKSTSFDYTGIYTTVKEHELIKYEMDDGRHVKIEFKELSKGVTITEIFEPENKNPYEAQLSGWQETLENFKKYVETN